jgi:hypothetical protein
VAWQSLVFDLMVWVELAVEQLVSFVKQSFVAVVVVHLHRQRVLRTNFL